MLVATYSDQILVWNKKTTLAKRQFELVNWSDWLKFSQLPTLGGPQKKLTRYSISHMSFTVKIAREGQGEKNSDIKYCMSKGMKGWNLEGQRSLLLSSLCTEAWWDYVGIMCPSARMQKRGLHPVECTHSAWAVLLILHCTATWSPPAGFWDSLRQPEPEPACLPGFSTTLIWRNQDPPTSTTHQCS